jgi:hypothetical protein
MWVPKQICSLAIIQVYIYICQFVFRVKTRTPYNGKPRAGFLWITYIVKTLFRG